MANLSSVARSAYGDLLRLLKDDMVANVRGSLVTKERGGKVYWYAAEKIGSDVKFWYIGPDSTETRNRVDRMNALREQGAERKKERARLARLLRAEGMTPIDRGTGGLLLAMAKVGTFRLGGTLIGTNAFRLMEGELGTTLPLGSAANTGDVDIAQFERLSVVLQDAVEPSLAETFSALKFDPVQGLDPGSVWRWRQSGQTGMMVEFLTPSFDAEEGIRDLPALGVKARALHHLNYLISDPIHAVALYRDGILVQIPRPEKFAVHKLVVADRRRDGPASFKAEKDRQQAAFIIETMSEDRPSDIWDAYADAMSRGPKWRERIGRTLERMPDTREMLKACEAG
ncbi:hypothetical protein FLO80_20865 [Aquicoccus porphyridii]|uniref:Nucleotidyltransferase-like domain-containing protein n=1 Tax=Aquicoccus porphyridii TaxID=1852029 RepID=A0A5A9YXL5_9RHOB|nr:GSU2403 family nucleotidyltransferase fold protein [Aquicoccus porphyridii]KAA0909587.1 hypothetical protein FLO80_20865 [Aquicoccus porphyridii]RAI51857.1 hypothetical protein DOO74_21010 [Rhodobacteraceae bacterium AsT-22]